MTGELIRPYGSVIIAVGAIITVFLTDWRTRKKDQEYKENRLKEQKESVRMLISLEIDKNLQMLIELWNKIQISDDENEDNDLDNESVKMAYKLINLPLIPWKNNFWNNQISSLPIALNKEEIQDVNDFYNNLEHIKLIYSELTSISKEDHEAYRIIEK